MQLTPGSKLGVFEIVAPIGAGGSPIGAPRSALVVIQNWERQLEALE